VITRDYLLRMIHQLGLVLAAVLKLNKEKRYDDALHEIHLSSRQLLGMDIGLLVSLSDDAVIRLLSLGDRFDAEKCIVAAELLRIVGEVKAQQGDETASFHCRTTSLSLFLELLAHETGTLPKEYFDFTEGLIPQVSSYELPLTLRMKMVRYYEYTGRFDLAENILFEIVESEPRYASEGVRFYTRLQSKSDEELRKGQLPRNEVEMGKRSLEQRLKQA